MKQLFVKYLVSFSYLLESSSRYKRVKRFFDNLLNNDDYPYKKYFDIFMVFIILSSVTILVVDVREHVAYWLEWYDYYIVTIIFIIEYELRLWVHGDMHKIIIAHYEEAEFFEKPFSLKKVFSEIFAQKWEFVTSLPAIIDLVAILPSYREIRVLRVFVLFRAFKMLRYSRSLLQFFDILRSKKVELYALFLLLAFFTLIASMMIYVFEGAGQNPNINSLFDAIYWAVVTVTTVGYGDITPVTHEGRFISILVIITGLGAITFLTSIIVSAFGEKLPEIKQTRVLNQVAKVKDLNLVCGYGKIGQIVSQKLKARGEKILVIENDPQKVERAELDGHRVLQADATKSATLLQLKLCDNVKSIIAVTHNDIINVFITINARSLCKSVEIIARCSEKSVATKLKLAGANHLIMPEEIAGLLGAVYIGQPVAFDALQAILTRKKSARIDEVEVKRGSFLDGKKVGDFDFTGSRLVLLAVLKPLKPDEKMSHYVLFNPPEETQLHAHDILVVMGYNVSIADFKERMLESVRYKKRSA
ncbi:NAD-binding protein [Hydrogenimonas urashimensis]|uniref:NAD-binding protein n=1 Tax=Hydrogenimonas urashimensis TaxID=2740515 RepID=UPI001916483A|nr:NAD-binding protein [Hydrogenimonas urashimensis]